MNNTKEITTQQPFSELLAQHSFFQELFEGNQGDLLKQVVQEGEVGLTFGLLNSMEKGTPEAKATLLYVALVNNVGNLAQTSSDQITPLRSLAEHNVEKALACLNVAEALRNPQKVTQGQDEGQIFVGVLGLDPYNLTVFKAREGEELETAKNLSSSKSRAQIIEVGRVNTEVLKEVGFSEKKSALSLVTAIKALEKRVDDDMEDVWKRQWNELTLTAHYLKQLETYKAQRRKLEREYSLPVDTSWIAELGSLAIGEQLSWGFGGDVLVFTDERMPDGYALCIDRIALMRLKDQPLQKGQKVSFMPTDADGLLIPDTLEFEVDESTRLVRKPQMSSLPGVYVWHSTTKQLHNLIKITGLYSRGEAILLQGVKRKTGELVPEFALPQHNVSMLFYCPPSEIAYEARIGESDGLSICRKVSAEEIKIPLQAVPGGKQRLTDAEGSSYLLGDEFLVGVHHR